MFTEIMKKAFSSKLKKIIAPQKEMRQWFCFVGYAPPFKSQMERPDSEMVEKCKALYQFRITNIPSATSIYKGASRDRLEVQGIFKSQLQV